MNTLEAMRKETLHIARYCSDLDATNSMSTVDGRIRHTFMEGTLGCELKNAR